MSSHLRELTMANNNAEAERRQLLADLDDLVQGLHSSELDVVAECVTNLLDFAWTVRIEIPPGQWPAIEDLMQKLVELTDVDDRPGLQRDAMKLLHDVCSIDEEASQLCDMLFDLDILPRLERLVDRLMFPNNDEAHHDQVLSAVPPLLYALTEYCSESVKSATTANAFKIIKPLLAGGSTLVMSSACKSIADISLACNAEVCSQHIVELGIVDRLVEITSTSTDPKLIQTALQIVGQLIEQKVQAVLDAGALAAIKRILSHEDLKCNVPVIYDTIMVVLGKNDVWLQAVVDGGVLPFVIELLRSDDENVQGDALYGIGEFTFRANGPQNRALVDAGVIGPLIDLLSTHRNCMGVVDAMLSLDCILGSAAQLKEYDAVREYVERLGFTDQLRMLTKHRDEEIREVAAELICKHCPEVSEGLEAAGEQHNEADEVGEIASESAKCSTQL